MNSERLAKRLCFFGIAVFAIAIMTEVLCAPVFASDPEAPAHVFNQDQSKQFKLFEPDLGPVKQAAKHTFVFWINGDADHFVPDSGSNPGSAVHRGDAIEEERIEKIASSCSGCNVVILHDQRGSDAWYKSSKPWATWLRVFSRGKLLTERHVSEIDETDPWILTVLLGFAQKAFPESEIHLIYRGHGFRETYLPGSTTVAPFDYSNPEHSYGEDDFVRSLRFAYLPKPLASITLASCSMASLNLAVRLSRYAQYFTASEVDVYEALDIAPRFDSLLSVGDSMDVRTASFQIAHGLFQAFKSTPVLSDAQMESPVTWMSLDRADSIRSSWRKVTQVISGLPEEIRKEFLEEALQNAALSKRVSARYVDSLKAAKKSPVLIALITSQIQTRSNNPGDLDLGLLLTAFANDPALTVLEADFAELQSQLRASIHVLDSPEWSKKLGLSVGLGDLVPRQ